MQCCTERRQQRSAVWCSRDRRANGAMPGDRAESSMQAGGMDAGYEAYLASMGAAAQEAPFEGGTMVPAEAAAAAVTGKAFLPAPCWT